MIREDFKNKSDSSKVRQGVVVLSNNCVPVIVTREAYTIDDLIDK